jgi:RimJ/RimL family protein N-acetyltransferase
MSSGDAAGRAQAPVLVCSRSIIGAVARGTASGAVVLGSRLEIARQSGTLVRVMVLETPRLRLRRFTPEDAPFIVALLNTPGWLAFIGDRGVRTEEDARRYLAAGPIASYAQHGGLGPYHVARRADGLPVGMCGLLRREILPDVDLGFAFLTEHAGVGYASEAAVGVLRFAQTEFGLRRVAGITKADNTRSIRVLEKLGLSFEREFVMPPKNETLRYYARSLD